MLGFHIIPNHGMYLPHPMAYMVPVLVTSPGVPWSMVAFQVAVAELIFTPLPPPQC